MKLEFKANWKFDDDIDLIAKCLGLGSCKYECRSNGQRCWCFTGMPNELSKFLWHIENKQIEVE
jgi:hypothetical protein